MSDFSLITHTLPKTISVKGKEYSLDTRTCKALQCFTVMDDMDVPDASKVTTILSQLVLGYAYLPVSGMFEAYEKVCEYLNGYPTKNATKSSKQILSYEQDHALIVAGFQQSYGISLDELKSMHWWRFLALLSGLPEDTRIASVMSIRAMPINPKDSPEQRQAKIKAKQSVAIAPKRKKKTQSGVDIISQALDAEGF